MQLKPTNRCALVLLTVAVFTTAGAACKARGDAGATADAAAAPPPGRAMKAALNDDLARQVRAILHPTGNGGISAGALVSCTPNECTATWDIAWSGGITNSPYTSTVVWTVDSSLTSSARVSKENSVIRADAKHIDQMNGLLQDVARGLTAPPDASGAATLLDGGSCQAAPFDAARLYKLTREPMTEKPEPQADPGRHRGKHPTYDYAFPDCHGLMLVTFQGKPNAWSLVCYRSCLSPEASKLGALEFLASSEFLDASGKPVRTKWHLITDGSLKGNIASFTGLGDGAAEWEISIDSPAAIQDDHTYFIYDWICGHRSDLAGFDKRRCGEP
jgi:hypothetical protein